MVCSQERESSKRRAPTQAPGHVDGVAGGSSVFALPSMPRRRARNGLSWL